MRRLPWWKSVLAGFFLLSPGMSAIGKAIDPATVSLVLYGEPKYPPGFTHFDYANPDAPKGGRVKLEQIGTFDSLNPFILKGVPMPKVSGYVFESLMTGSEDEPQSYYPLLARSLERAADGSGAVFHLDPRARWQDGTPVTAADIVFSLDMMKTKADPSFQLVYKPMRAEATDARTVHFIFDDKTNRQLVFYAAGMPVVSKAYYTAHPFDQTSLDPPLGSGPYRVSKVDAGRAIEFERVKDYWGRDIPSRKGAFNFDTIHYDVYRDETVALEGFKAHAYDLREENIARNWATAYNFDAVADGRVRKFIEHDRKPHGMQAFIFNLRRDRFADRRVRQAIGLTLDFEWMNHALFFDAYERNNSFFQNTDFAARSLPSADEVALLDPFRAILPPEVFTTVYNPPKTDGSGNIRPALIEAQKLLNAAGWIIRDGKRVNAKTGEKLTLEFMLDQNQTSFQRLVMPMIHNLQRLGIDASLRLVDDAQYVKRTQSKDFDLISIWWNLGLNYPGNEQAALWSSAQADVNGSGNDTGLKNPAVDAILARIVAAKDLAMLVTAGRALDRVLLWEQTVIPHWSIGHFRTAYWNIFGLPDIHPGYTIGFDEWWVKPDVAAAQKKGRSQ